MAEFSTCEDIENELLKLKQIPSSVKSQDVSHKLTTLFKDLLQNSNNTDIIENRVISKGSDDPYHERYVSQLQKLFEEKERRVAQLTNLEHYILQAQAKVLSTNEKLYNQYKSTGINKNLITNESKSESYSTIDMKMLKDNGLITPDDYIICKRKPVSPPGAPQQVIQNSSKAPPTKNTLKSGHQVSDTSNLQTSEKSVSKTDVKRPPRKDLVFPASNAWKEYPSLIERLRSKNDLARMEAKANFLRNPRHMNPSLLNGISSLIQKKKTLTETNISLQEDKNEESYIFKPIPKEILFKEYKIGQIYEATLELKNVSTVLRPCRVIPPASKYFTIGLGQFPADHGLIAPGMSCLYTIRFAPDSLGDFIDELKVFTQSSNTISVPLLGKRPCPNLTLPTTINIGHCLVGGIQVTQVVIKNRGGCGCFCLLPTSSWPNTNFRTIVHDEIVSIPPFRVRPSTFEMKSGQVGVLEIVFQPEEEKTYQGNVTLICDNCQVKNFVILGVAQIARVTMDPSKDVYTEPASEENPDKPEKHLISFDDLNLFSYQEKGFSIKNCTNVELPFYWLKYEITTDCKNQEKSVYSKVMAGTPPFSIYPTCGILPPDESVHFETIFAPEKVNSYRCVTQMILENVPDIQNINEENDINKNSEIPGEKTQIKDDRSEHVSLSIELQGRCTPFNITLNPYAMFIHGQIYCGIIEKKEFSLINNSISPIQFKWDLFVSEFYMLKVEPSTAKVAPSEEIDLILYVSGYRQGPINHQLKCYLEYQQEPIFYNVQADIKVADIGIDEPNVDFGLVCNGQSAKREITLNNKSPIEAEFSVQEISKSDLDLTELKIEPENGTLQPMESCKVSITYYAQNVLSFSKYISVQVIGGEQSTVLVYGEVQNPQVVLKSCQLHLEKLYHNVPCTYQVVLINNTLLPTQFEWQEAFGSQARFCDIQMIPQSGCIGPREELQIDLIFTSYKKVLFHDIFICCQIKGMETQPCLSVLGDVMGLKVEYNISQESTLTTEQSNEAEKIINFGETVPINSLSNVYIHIINQSAIDTTFTAYIEHFPARLPSPPPEDKHKVFPPRKDSIWKRYNMTKPPGTFLTSIDTELKNSYLRDNNGAAFLITPANGQLPAHGSVVLQVSAVNNMWGQYSDTFCCQVGDLEIVTIPILLNVVGAPLRFLMMGPHTDQEPILRFGSDVAGNDPTDRKLRISNTSPFDIRIDWLGFNIYNDDEKLLDLKVIYDDPFPILDQNGLEMCPPTPPATPDHSEILGVEQKEENDAKFDSDKFIKLIAFIHRGVESDTPFSIVPRQMVIAAYSDTHVMVRFTPPPAQEVMCERFYTSFGHGYLNFCNMQENEKSSRISRQNSYGIDPLVINMTARVLPAQLLVDFMGEDRLHIESSFGELLEHDKLCGNKIKISSLKLLNQTETRMDFVLLCQPPFTFINLQQSSSNETLSTSLTLYPQKQLTVKVGFILSSYILSYLKMIESKDNSCALDGISLKTVGKESWLHFTKTITVQFKNKMTQTITAEASVALPDFEVSTNHIDFGVCWIGGQQKWEEFTLTNKSPSKTFFSIKTDVLCHDSCVFDVDCISGNLDGHVNNNDAYWTKIKIFHDVKKVGKHQAELTINGIMGEKTQKIILRSHGSHDDRHCSIAEG